MQNCVLSFLRGAFRFRRVVAALATASVLSFHAVPLAHSNDGFYELASGGLRLSKADNITIISEDLRISMSRVTVTYEIKNMSDTPQQALIGFPLPHPDALADEVDGPGPEGVARMLNSFTTTVNGRRIKTAGRDVAVYLYPPYTADEDSPASKVTAALDITQTLRDAGIIFTAENVTLTQLDDEKAAARVAALLPPPYSEDFPGWWEVRQIPYWQQKFAAGETISVVHSYVPVPGGAIAGSFNIVDGNVDFDTNPTGYEFLSAELDFKRLRKNWENATNGAPIFCSVEEDNLIDIVKQGIQARYREVIQEENSSVFENVFVTISSDMTYILSTARSWFGPIGKFRLTVDGEGMALMFCLPGEIKLSDPDSFVYEAEIENFDPATDLEIIRLF